MVCVVWVFARGAVQFQVAVSTKLGILFVVGVLTIREHLLFGLYIRAKDFRELPYE